MTSWPEINIGSINICGYDKNTIVARDKECHFGEVIIKIEETPKVCCFKPESFEKTWVSEEIVATAMHYLRNNKDFYTCLPAIALAFQKEELEYEIDTVDDELIALEERRCQIEKELRNLS